MKILIMMMKVDVGMFYYWLHQKEIDIEKLTATEWLEKINEFYKNYKDTEEALKSLRNKEYPQ